MKVKTKLTLSLSSLTFIVLVLGIFALNSLNKLESQNEIYSSLFKANLNLYQGRLAQADFMLTEDIRFAKDVHKYLDKSIQLLIQVKKTMVVAQSIHQINDIQESVKNYEKSFTELEKIVANNSGIQSYSELTHQIMAHALNASQKAESLITAEKAIAEEVRSSIYTAIIVAIAAALIISAVLAFWLVKSILTPLALSGQISKAIASGNLAYSKEVIGDDEFSDLNRELMSAMGIMKLTVNKIKETMERLADISSLIGKSVDGSSKSMEEQKIETDLLATAIEEMSASASEISSSAMHASSVIDKAENEAKQGNEVIINAQNSMSRLTSAMEKTTLAVRKLDDDSKNIHSILQVIQGIAEQTNLLALNAAIEAARAGEQGRGFAVVADEVRQLAQRTHDSTTEIAGIVELLQNGASDTVVEIENSNVISNQVVSLNEKASFAYSRISDSVDHIVDINAQVATGAEEQTHVATELNININKIKNLTDGNSGLLKQIKEQIEVQTKATDELKSSLDFFSV